MRKKVYGVGVNNANYETKDCMFYKVWKDMLKRCYSLRFQKRYPTYIGCTVEPKWLYFMAFRQWMASQDWVGKHLDKDILVPGNKIYSLHTCCFIPPHLNMLLNTYKARRGNCPLGVSKKGTRYIAQIAIGGKVKHLGSFSTPSEASCTYNLAKAAEIRRLAKSQFGSIKIGLYKHAKMYEQGKIQ